MKNLIEILKVSDVFSHSPLTYKVRGRDIYFSETSFKKDISEKDRIYFLIKHPKSGASFEVDSTISDASDALLHLIRNPIKL